MSKISALPLCYVTLQIDVGAKYMFIQYTGWAALDSMQLLNV